MHNVIILRGVPGSGKSTWIAKNYPNAEVFSADHYFIRNGEYKFDPRLLPDAHAYTLRSFVGWARDPSGTVAIVDNTCTTVAEVAPYAAIALAYGRQVETVTLLCDPAVAGARNIHGVPLAAVEAMDRRLRASQGDLAPWWNNRVVEV